MQSKAMRCPSGARSMQRHALRCTHQRTHSAVVASCSSRLEQQQQQQQASIGQIVSSMAAAAILLSSAQAARAEAIYAAGPSQYSFPAAERYAEQQEQRFDEYLQTPELKDLLQLLDKSSYKQSDLESARLKVRSAAMHSQSHACMYFCTERAHAPCTQRA